MDHEHVEEIFSRSPLAPLLPIVQAFKDSDYDTYRRIGAAIFEAYMAGMKDAMTVIKENILEDLC